MRRWLSSGNRWKRLKMTKAAQTPPGLKPGVNKKVKIQMVLAPAVCSGLEEGQTKLGLGLGKLQTGLARGEEPVEYLVAGDGLLQEGLMALLDALAVGGRGRWVAIEDACVKCRSVFARQFGGFGPV